MIEVDRCSVPSLAPYPHHTSPLLQLLALASAVVHQTTAAPPPPLWPADNTGNEHFAAMLLLRSRTTLLPFPFSSQATLKDHLVEQLDTGQGWFASFVTEAGLISGRTHPTSKAFVLARWNEDGMKTTFTFFASIWPHWKRIVVKKSVITAILNRNWETVNFTVWENR